MSPKDTATKGSVTPPNVARKKERKKEEDALGRTTNLLSSDRKAAAQKIKRKTSFYLAVTKQRKMIHTHRVPLFRLSRIRGDTQPRNSKII
jgi:hypothetical protein